MMASLRSRPRADGTLAYQVGYRVGGKLAWSPTLDSPADAAWLKDMIERLGHEAALAVLTHRTGSTRTVPTVREWTDKHLTLLAASASAGTPAEYRRMAERTWMPRLGDYPLDAITRDVVTEWVAWQRQQETARSARARAKATAARTPVPAPVPIAPKTIRNAHGLLSSVLSSAVDAGQITRNPARGVPLPSDRTDAEKEILTRAEWDQLRAALPTHYLPLTVFLITTGCRIGEATAIQVRDLDLTATTPTVRVRRAWKKGATGVYLGSTKTRRGNRTIRLGLELAALLRPIVAQATDPEALVFTSVEGKRVSSQHYRSRVWMPAVARAGILKHVTPHDLRHTSASWLLMAGIAPQVVQHRLGHESLQTTSRVYAHLLTDAQADAADLMDVAAGKTVPQIEA